MSRTWLLVGACAIVLLFQLPVSSACGRGAIILQDNVYKQTLVAISEAVPEDLRLIDRIKEAFTEASYTLFKATRYRARFGEIRILLPKTWSPNVTYQPVKDETLDTSDIVVDVPDAASGNGHRPFVIKTTPCGELGYYMHLTPEYLLNETIAGDYGPYDKVLVHEWGHLRYGVFDEYATDTEGDHYYVAAGGTVEPTRCSKEIQGSWMDIENGKTCTFTGGIPDKNCRFKPDSVRGSKYASLMYGQYLEQVTEYCDDDVTNGLTLHNREAPNQQNRMCGGKSVWEVMRSHADFANNANPPLDIEEYQEPTFRVLRADIKRTVLVLDTSGSMGNEQRIEKQNQGCTNFIATIMEDGEKLGIVKFAGTATALKQMTEITDVTRKELIGVLPIKATGTTSIGSGIREGIKVLKNDGGTEGAALLIVSDGQEMAAPYIDDVMDEVMRSGVTVHTIAFTDAADNKLDSLAHNTGGLAFLYSGKDTSNALNEAFETIGALNRNPRTSSFTISSEAMTMSAAQVIQGEGIVDATLGRDTEFLFDYGSAGIGLDLESPNGNKYTEGSTECHVDSTVLTVRCLFSGSSEVGKWKYNITNKATKDQRLAITIKSKSIDPNEYPIIAQAFWGSDQLDMGSSVKPKQLLYASVSKGYVAVLNAIVEAEVETPKDPVKLTLKDNGAGADATKDDGVYSAYFTEIKKNGRYNVKVTVNSDAATMINPQYIVGRGAAEPKVRNRRDVVNPTGDFQRSASGGVFQITNMKTEPTDKIYPPGQINDLTVRNTQGHDVTLAWTAPGAELDVGTVSYYEIWLSRSHNFSEGLYATLSQENVTSGNLTNPKPPHQTENITLELSPTGEEGYYFAVVAYDTDRTTPVSSPLSNIVVTWLAESPPQEPTTESPPQEPTTESPPRETTKEDDLTWLWILIGVLGGVLLIMLIILIVCLVHNRNRSKVDAHSAVHVASMTMYSLNQTEKMKAVDSQNMKTGYVEDAPPKYSYTVNA